MGEAKQAGSELRAEHKALSDLLSRGQGAAVWTPVLDTIDVRAGYEKALVAAFGDDLDAALGGDAPLRWDGADKPASPLPSGAKPLSEFVKAPAAMSASLSQVGLIEASDKALAVQLTPGQRLVSIEGDLWRWDGFVANADAPSPAAQKLEQQNRLAVVANEIDAAQTKFEAQKPLLVMPAALCQTLSAPNVRLKRRYRVSKPTLPAKRRSAKPPKIVLSALTLT